LRNAVCGFCGKRRHEVPAMAAGEVRICAQCLTLCREVIDEARR
jgi:ATP-dependent protease Clp ATPase subunit